MGKLVKGTNPIDVSIGAQLRSIRLEKGIADHDCAAAIGTSLEEYRRLETGQSRLFAEQMFGLAKLLDTPISSFFEGLT